MNVDGCPFCQAIAKGQILLRSQLAAAIPDGFPVSRGHTLVVPLRHISSYFDLTSEEQAEIWSLVSEVQRSLASAEHPSGFNVGLNDGAAAGQTVGHAHVHVIPRYAGDVEDPRGGVRWVVGAKAAYWKQDR